MSGSRIDEAILSAVEERWMKVAMVIAKVAKAVGGDLPPGDEGGEAISRRIEVLFRTACWRHRVIRGTGDSARFGEHLTTSKPE
jgi:hypothetical protein